MNNNVLYERVEKVARITMNRPKYRNAQSRKLLEELDAAFAEAMADPDVRVVVLFGAGEHWSSGHDIGTPEEVADQRARPYPPGLAGTHQRSWDWNVENTMRWRDLPKPTLAAVQGLCIWGGWMVAAAMDLIMASDDARFVPGLVQYQSTPWDIGLRRAKDLLWENGLIDATQAHELGFVCEVVPRAELDKRAMAKAARIARMKPMAAQMIKRQINDAQDSMGFRAAIAAGHSSYLLGHLHGGALYDDEHPFGSVKRLRAVDIALNSASTNEQDPPDRATPDCAM
jgi:enoyl-CoA hydratase